MNEIWKDIPEYEGLYQISNLGRVKSLERITIIPNAKRIEPEKIMKLNIRNGYNVINLRKDGKKKSKQIHRLVAEAFIPNPDNLPVVNHKDYNPFNNKVDNLEWTTQSGNVQWSIERMKHRKSITHSNTGEKYITYRKNTNDYRLTFNKKEYRYKSLEEAIIKRNELLNETI